ncbi:MAG TPA: CusA/CzcA family heavy metal efflux RND transporter [Thermodesulfobacteriota bacterium]|nr:CusA/CzcA family heavy metal efflux RND transporter [Thermodesulfobacteriota bacterium]
MRRWIIFVTEKNIVFLLLGSCAFLISLFLVKDLNVEAFPDPSAPQIEAVVIYEGKSAEEVEKRITLPMEVGLASMRGLQRLTTTSLYGLCDIKCKFSYDIPYREARQEVINRFSNIVLPDGAQPTIIASDMGEVMQYVLVGSNNLMELRTLQEWVAARYIKTAQGVQDVASYGGFIKAYVVTVRPEDLIKYGITLSQVIEGLSKSNINVGGRVVELGDQYYMVRGLGLIRSLPDIENSVIAYKGGKAILIKNVAQVKLGNIPRTGIIIFNKNDDAVMGNVIIRRGEKSIPTIRSINEKVADLNGKILPKGIKAVPYYERWGLITTVIKKVVETASSGVFLVAVGLFLFLGNLRAAIMTALVIPFSLAITLAVMAMRGDSANLLSIGAIDFGIIADVALVLTENYIRVARQYALGRGPLTRTTGERALIKAAGEVGTPIILLVLIILLAFIPIFTMKGAEKQIFSPMAETYCYVLLFTLILTLTFLAASIHTFLEGHEGTEFRFFEILQQSYLKLISLLLRKPRIVILLTSLILLTGFGVGFKVIGTQFLPKLDEGNIYIRITFPYSISLTKTHENAKRVRDILIELPEAKSVAVRIGRPEDGTEATGPSNTEYYVNLHPYNKWQRKITKEQLEEEVRQKLTQLFPRVNISLSQYMEDNLNEVTSGVKGENVVKVFGENLQELDRIAQEIEKKIGKVPGIEGVGLFKELGQPNLLIEVDRENASAVGLTVQEVLDMVSAALGGKVVSQVVEGDKNFALQVSFPYDYRREPDKIGKIPVVLPTGGIIPLARVAKIRYDTGASFIFRENHKRLIPVKFSVVSKDLGGTVMKAQKETEQIKLPEGYFLDWAGQFNEMLEAFRRFYLSIPFAIFLISILLYLFYGNMRNVALTAVAPICSVFGGVVCLLLTGESLSISAVVGFVSVIGISIFNTCIWITHYIEIYREKKDEEKATLETTQDKFRPVLMGGLIASLGLFPASIAHGVGSQVQKPLALVVVGGMFIGTLIILLVMPLLFKFVKVGKK